MLQAQRTTSSGWASAIGHALAIEGLDIVELFADAGLEPGFCFKPTLVYDRAPDTMEAPARHP